MLKLGQGMGEAGEPNGRGRRRYVGDGFSLRRRKGAENASAAPGMNVSEVRR
jgi:hypothetical protein